MNKIGLFIWTERWLSVLKKIFENWNYQISWVLILIQKSDENNIAHDKIIEYCVKHNIEYDTSLNIKPSNYINFIKKYNADIMFAISWRYLISKECFNIQKYWIFILHDALLPKYRWFAPTNWVIINWEEKTWLTLQTITEDCDEWDIIDQIEIEINQTDDANTLNNKLIKLYPEIILKNIDSIFNKTNKLIKQNDLHATYWCKRIFEDGKINFNLDIDSINNLIRWLTWPYYWAFCYLNNNLIYIWETEKAIKGKYVWIIPWRVVWIYNNWVWVMCGDWNVLIIKKISTKNNKSTFINPNTLIKSITLTLK